VPVAATATKAKAEPASKADKTAKPALIEKPAAANKPEKVAKPAESKAAEVARPKEMDCRTLFIKNLPKECTEEEVKSLSSDIIACRIKVAKTPKNRPKGKNFAFAFVEFASEEITTRNYKALQHKKNPGFGNLR